jgi:transcription termination factor Rho
VAPARAGKTTLLQAIVEGVSTNHPDASLFVLLVDERPEEVSEMIMWGYGEVVASSFDMPAKRHVEVAEMVLERSRRIVEQGKDVVIVLDSITRLARATTPPTAAAAARCPAAWIPPPCRSPRPSSAQPA